MNLYGLIHICLLGAPHQIIPPFLMFRDVRELYNLPRGRNKYNKMDNIVNPVEMAYKRCCGWYI